MPGTYRAIGVFFLTMVVVAATIATLSAKDWPQWRGAERLGLWTETGILQEFPDSGLTVTWRVPVNGGYSGPAVADGRVYVLDYVETEARVMNGTERLFAVDEETGELYWEEEFAGRANMTVADAVKSGSYLFVSGFYSGSLMMRIDLDRPAATPLWRGENNRVLERGIEVAETTGLHSVMTTPLVVGDHIYGIGSHGQVRGLLAETGERVWEAEGLTTRNRWGSAYFIEHEDRYFVYNENGDLIIVQFSPDGYVELDRTHLLNPTSRSGYGGSRPGSRGRARHG